MKSKITKILCILFVCVFMFMFSSCAGPLDKKPQYKENADGMALYRYKSKSTEDSFSVPEEYEGKRVTELQAFSIANAEYLKKIHIGKNVETIDVWALTNCQNLEAIEVDAENPNYSSLDGVLYNKDQTELLCYPNAKSPIVKNDAGEYVSGGEFIVPSSVKIIRENAFYLCSGLYKIALNEGLEKIENKAFLKCTNLATLEIPSTVTEIGVDAFSYCDALNALEIPSNVQKIGDYAFYATASSIETIHVHQDKPEDIELGKEWYPNKKNTVHDKVTVEYVGKD